MNTQFRLEWLFVELSISSLYWRACRSELSRTVDVNYVNMYLFIITVHCMIFVYSRKCHEMASRIIYEYVMISTIIRCSDLVICMVRLVISGIRNSNLSDQFVTSVKCMGWSRCSKVFCLTLSIYKVGIL